MPRPRTGSISRDKNGLWQAIITLNDGSRLRLDPFPHGTSKAKAKEMAAHYSERARRENITLPSKQNPDRITAPTMEDKPAKWWRLFFADRVARGLSSVDDDRGRFKHHIAPVIAKHMGLVTTEDCEVLRDALDTKIRSGIIAAKTAANIWTLWTTACKKASTSKVKALRVRRDNPCTGVEPPDPHSQRAKPWLYPSEFLKLMECDAVPLNRRRRVALAVYFYDRGGELRALEWSDVKLDEEMVHRHRSMDRNQRDTKDTKSSDKLDYTIEPNLLPLLQAMHDESGGEGRVIDMPARKYWARQLREDLLTAGVTREALFANDNTRRHLVFHDLKATAITWMALRGDNPLHMMRRASHSDFKTTQGYMRTAELVGPSVGEPFPELPACLLGESIKVPHRASQIDWNTSNSRQIEWSRRESNPGPRGLQQAFVHVCSRIDPSDGVRGFGHDLAFTNFGGVIERVLAHPSPGGWHAWGTRATFPLHVASYLRNSELSVIVRK